MKSRVLLVDDHQIVLDGLKRIITDSNAFEVMGNVNSGHQALQLLQHMPVDLLLTDLDMPEMHGSDLVRRVKENYPEIKVIVLSMHTDPVLVKELVSIGADGFLVKTTSEEEIILALKKVAQGQQYYSTDITTSLMNQTSHVSDIQKKFQLTQRELEILQLVADGFSTKEIGEQLFISIRTVDSHRLSIMKKLDVKNIAELVRFAFKNALID